MKKLPAFQFYPGDWKKDPALSSCSAATRGFWLDLICVMYEMGNTGEITADLSRLSKYCRCSPKEAELALDELSATGAANISKDGDWITITCRRIRREHLREHQTKCLKGDWPTIRKNTLKRDKYICGYCGQVATAVDHIVPRCLGGSNDQSNLIAACKPCNSKKKDRLLKQVGMRIKFKSGRTLSEREVAE